MQLHVLLIKTVFTLQILFHPAFEFQFYPLAHTLRAYA
jgi:hypothetical protein